MSVFFYECVVDYFVWSNQLWSIIVKLEEYSLKVGTIIICTVNSNQGLKFTFERFLS